MFNVNDNRFTPAICSHIEPTCNLLENTINCGVSNRGLDWLGFWSPIIVDIKELLSSSVKVHALSQHPLRELAQAIQGIGCSSLRKLNFFKLCLFVFGRLFKELCNFIIDIVITRRTSRVRQCIDHESASLTICGLPPFLEPLHL